MKQALIVVKKIKDLEKVINNTNSIYLKQDYRKQINRLKKDLKDYCFFKNYNYNDLLKKA